ncbi:MAG: hypothetical protein R3300_11920, partial [Candidatus Promineifilaceae bacterium]|nr:hypothetical protein [Candidatus Promineifilaceae bacterium]
IMVFNQPVVDGAIEIERAVSYGPGWLVVYRQEEDEQRPGNIIGWTALEDGINQRVVVTLTQSALTAQLYLALHEDTGEVGEFGFPVTDPPVRVDGRLPNPALLETTPGSYLITEDQALSSSGTISIPLVVVDEPVWVVVETAPAEEQGTIIGRTWVPAGVNHDVVVAVNATETPLAVAAALHRDAGTALVFDFPDGPDTALQRNLGPIRAPFDILEADEE